MTFYHLIPTALMILKIVGITIGVIASLILFAVLGVILLVLSSSSNGGNPFQ